MDKYEKLRNKVVWAVTHYGIVNTDGIIETLRETVLELDTDKLQNTPSNSDYAKFPTIVAIVDNLNGGKNLGWTCGDVEPIVKAIKELGNFA